MNAEALDWFARETVAPGVTRLWEPAVHRFFRANIFHVSGSDADLVIDFGMGQRPLRPALAIPDGKPVIAVATHGHVDHIGGFHEFSHEHDRRAGHPAEAETFRTVHDAGTLADLFCRQPEAASPLPAPCWQATGYRLQPAPLTMAVGEGDVIDLGDKRLSVLHLPGHSPGSIGLLDTAGSRLFAGDAVYRGQIVDDVPGADIAAYRRTMARLAGLDVAQVLGGHGPPIDGDEMHAIAHAYLHMSGHAA